MGVLCAAGEPGARLRGPDELRGLLEEAGLAVSGTGHLSAHHAFLEARAPSRQG